MTDETPLTEESERLLAMAEHWRDDCKTRCAVTARVRDAVHLIEAAAARRAIEGSGVRALRMLVESAVLVSLEADEDPFDAWVVSPDALDYARSTLADLRESC